MEESFWIAKNRTSKMAVVIGIAERGVKLIEEYNKILTNDKQQEQYLLQVVSSYQKCCQ